MVEGDSGLTVGSAPEEEAGQVRLGTGTGWASDPLAGIRIVLRSPVCRSLL